MKVHGLIVELLESLGHLGGGFNDFLILTPVVGGDDLVLRTTCFKGVETIIATSSWICLVNVGDFFCGLLPVGFITIQNSPPPFERSES